MRILHVYSGIYTGGGIIKKIINLVKSDKSNTHELLFIWYADPMNKRAEMMKYLDDVKVAYHYTYKKSILRNIPFVRNFLKHNKYDLAHFYTDNVMIIGKIVKLLGVNMKYVRSFEGAPMYDKFPARQLVNWAFSATDSFVAISEFVKQSYLSTYTSLRNSNITVVYNALVHKLKRKKTISERNGIICVGTLTGQKQFDNAIKTISVLRHQYNRQIPLYILGSGKDKEKLQNLARDLGVADLIFFVGVVQNPESYYDKCRLFLHPAYREGFGLVVLEAMKMELGVLVANSGALPEIIEDGKTGFVLPLKDSNVWAKKINQLYNQDALLDEIGANARQIVESKFSLEQHIQGYLNFYESAK